MNVGSIAQPDTPEGGVRRSREGGVFSSHGGAPSVPSGHLPLRVRKRRLTLFVRASPHTVPG